MLVDFEYKSYDSHSRDRRLEPHEFGPLEIQLQAIQALGGRDAYDATLGRHHTEARDMYLLPPAKWKPTDLDEL